MVSTTTNRTTALSKEVAPEPIKRVSIIISKGSLEGVYPGLIMANGARMEGIEAMVFFTFFGMNAILKNKMYHLKVAIPPWECQQCSEPFQACPASPPA